LQLESSLMTDARYDETLLGASVLGAGDIESYPDRAFSRAMLRATVRCAIRLGIVYVGDAGVCSPIKRTSARLIAEADRRDNGFPALPAGTAADATIFTLARRINWGVLRGWLSLAREHAVLE